MVMAQDGRLRLGIQLQKESIENALLFTRYDQMKFEYEYEQILKFESYKNLI